MTVTYLWLYRHVPDWLREATWLAFMLAVLAAALLLLLWLTGWNGDGYQNDWRS